MNLRSAAVRAPKYETDAARLQARRETWRRASQKRRHHAKAERPITLTATDALEALKVAAVDTLQAAQERNLNAAELKLLERCTNYLRTSFLAEVLVQRARSQLLSA